MELVFRFRNTREGWLDGREKKGKKVEAHRLRPRLLASFPSTLPLSATFQYTAVSFSNQLRRAGGNGRGRRRKRRRDGSFHRHCFTIFDDFLHEQSLRDLYDTQCFSSCCIGKERELGKESKNPLTTAVPFPNSKILDGEEGNLQHSSRFALLPPLPSAPPSPRYYGTRG